jgi:hypothetical protein
MARRPPDRSLPSPSSATTCSPYNPGYLFRTDPEWAIWCRGVTAAEMPALPKMDLQRAAA